MPQRSPFLIVLTPGSSPPMVWGTTRSRPAQHAPPGREPVRMLVAEAREILPTGPPDARGEPSWVARIRELLVKVDQNLSEVRRETNIGPTSS